MAKSSAALRHVAAGWTLFAGSHLAMSHPPVRKELVDKLGEDRFKGVYSLVSLATFLPTTFIYARSAAGVGVIPLWTTFSRSFPARMFGNSFKVVGALTFGQGLAVGSSNMDARASSETKEVKGIERITRHPAFTSLALLGIGNMLTRGHAGDVIYWSGFPLFLYVGCLHQDGRLKEKLPAQYYDETSVVPFMAIIEGRNSLKLAVEEFNKPAAVMAVVAPLFLL